MRGPRLVCLSISILLALVFASSSTLAGNVQAATPQPLVEAYESLAETLLAANKTERSLVNAILATTYQHAEGVMRRAQGKIEAGKEVRGDLETLATLVSQLANEGDASVAAIRKRLLEGGHHHHHHHAGGENDQQFDEGFVIVTRAAKKIFLDASQKIARLGRSPDSKALETEWNRVAKQFQELQAGTKD